MSWLRDTPDAHTEIAHMVISVIPKRTAADAWLMVRSTLPDGLTRAVLDEAFADRATVAGTLLARFEAQSFAEGRYTALGQRSVHPAGAGIRSYQTGAGKGVEQAITTDDQVLTAAGHAIATHEVDRERHQVGIAFDSHKVWRHSYLSLEEYHALARDIARAIEHGPPPATLAGLRIPGTRLDPEAKPIAAELDVDIDPHFNAQLVTDAGTFELAELTAQPRRKTPAGPIDIALRHRGRFVAGITILPDGTIDAADGTATRDGQRQTLEESLNAHPPALYFDDGSYLRGPDGHIGAGNVYLDYFAIAEQAPRLTDAPHRDLNETNQVLTVPGSAAKLTEKGPTETKVEEIVALAARVTTQSSRSLLQWTAKQLIAEDADFIYCDDGTLEQADVIAAWRVYPATGLPHVRLVHCKAKSPSEPAGASLTTVETVVQQALRSVSFLLAPPERMVAHCVNRSVNLPKRFIRGNAETFNEILTLDPVGRSNEMWIVHPGLSALSLAKPRGRRTRALLGSVRARLRNVAIDLAVIASD